MALIVGSGEITITAAGGTGSKTYAHGLSFTPTLTLWFSSGVAAGSSANDDARWMFGASADSTHEWCTYGWSDDAASDSATGSGISTDASIAFPESTNTYDMQADFTSVDGTNFTLNVSDAPAADRVVQFISFAGAGLSVHVDNITPATGTSQQAFTGVGFQPKLLLFGRGRLPAGAANAVAAYASMSLGASTGAGAEWSNSFCSRDNQATSDVNQILTATRSMLGVGTGAGGNTASSFQTTAIGADGFSITPTVSLGTGTVIGYVAIAGTNFSAKVGTSTISTTNTTLAVTGVGFKPQALLTSMGLCTVAATFTASGNQGFGVAHGSSNRAASFADPDNVSTTNTSVSASATKNMLIYGSGNTVVFDGALSSFDTDGFTENYTTTNGIAYLFGYVAMRDNAAPVITSNGGGATANINSAENQTVVTTVTATDADSDTITYSKSGTDAAFFNIDSGTGVLTWASAPNFESKLDGNADGVYLVTVTASDGTLTDSQDLSVTVTNVNEAPVITSNGGGASASISVAENQTAVTTVVATDVDAGTTITYSISAGADSALFGIDSSTGVLTFLVAPDFEDPQDADTDNDYAVTVRASDGSLTDTQALTITVTDITAGSGEGGMGPPGDEDDEIGGFR